MATSASQHILNDEEKKLLLDRYSDLKFVDDVTELSCKRCGHVLIHHYVANCGHVFCRNCQRILNDGKGWRCPQCKEYITQIVEQNPEVEERVYGQMVHCLNHKYGCKITMTLRQIPDHLKSCKDTRDANLPRLLYPPSYDESYTEMIKELNAKVSKMEETANLHAEEIKRLREVLQSQTAIEDKIKQLDDSQRSHAERMKEKMERWKNNILVETTRLQIQTSDNCNQKIREIEDKATHVKQHVDELQTETKTSLLQKLHDIEGKIVVMDNCQRQDFQIKLDQLSATMREHVDDIKKTMAQMSDAHDKRAALDKAIINQDIKGSKLNENTEETIQMKGSEETRPVPEYNILVLGDSGSGKSTFINSLANYIDHDQLNDALSGGPARCLIPTTIVYQKQEIPIEITEDCEVKAGEPNPTCRTYVIDYNGCQMRLIDTSGYGRSNGSRLNLNILKFIGDCQFGINVIAIVVKSNQSKLHPNLNDLFQSILSNTLTIKVLFILSHCETTNYRAGDVIGPLKQLLAIKSSPAVESLTYCFENKGLLYFLLGKQRGHLYYVQFENSSHKAWKFSAEECKRLLQSLTANRKSGTFITRQLIDNVSVTIEAKQCYKLCSDYMKQISENNDKFQKELESCNAMKEQLYKQLKACLRDGKLIYYEVTQTEVSPKEYVCASDRCRRDITTKDGTVKEHYPQKCRYRLYGPSGIISDMILGCSNCGCRAKEHIFLPYTTNLEQLQFDVEVSIVKIKSDIRATELRMDELDKELIEYATIEKVSDALENLVKCQTDSGHDSVRTYCREDNNKLIGKSQSNTNDLFFQLKRQLFDLEIHGQKIKTLFDTIND